MHNSDRTRGVSPWLALGVLSLSMLMIILDGTIVSVAMPALARDLGFSPAGLSWTVDAYLVPLGGLLLVAGRVGDLIGPRRMLLAGLVVFTVASIACGAAPGTGALVAARAVQGVGAAMASSVVLGMVVGLFDDAADRARAMGVYAFVGAAGASIGLLLGGVLTDTLGWRAIFWINAPIGLVALVASLRTLAPDADRDRTARPDVLGAVLVTAGLAAAITAIVEPAGGPWVRLALGLVALALLAGFVRRQQRASDPLVPLPVLRLRSVAVGNLSQALLVAGAMGYQFAAALYLQDVLGLDPWTTGWAMLPVPLLIATVALGVAGRLIARFGARTVLLSGATSIAAGLVWMALGSGYVAGVLPALVLLGVGAGQAMPAVTTALMADASPERAGLVSGLANTSQQAGGAVGVAVVGVVAAGAGYGIAFGVAAVLVVAAAGIATALPGRRRVPAPAPAVRAVPDPRCSVSP
ncbi:MFS transporter [Actinomycetospora termitidis]|uniref:MFS transporter n=1 Tax=Actinomycetospora termitidis TaxID=3053470 RepID=A0ABT7M2Z1_9PSEU|nr:MFS transporter [Actinomycetospora sp. Odt1-22]MDL5155031.1 MFS transporter [Actinomycetospora sp. Odt1-22]